MSLTDSIGLIREPPYDKGICSCLVHWGFCGKDCSLKSGNTYWSIEDAGGHLDSHLFKQPLVNVSMSAIGHAWCIITERYKGAIQYFHQQFR